LRNLFISNSVAVKHSRFGSDDPSSKLFDLGVNRLKCLHVSDDDEMKALEHKLESFNTEMLRLRREEAQLLKEMAKLDEAEKKPRDKN
jgi:hypothetical protein